jgi:vitamin B12 transporter
MRVAAFILASLVSIPLLAQEPPELPEVVVTATRIESPALDVPSFVTVIGSADIEKSGAAGLAELLATQSGITVGDNGTKCSVTSAHVRGSTSAQVLVLLDGMRLNSSRDGMIDLSTIPLALIEKIEIVRGGESSLYGTGAIGGVINIITKKAETPEISLGITNESYIPHGASVVTEGPVIAPAAENPMDLIDSQKVELSVSGKLGDVGLTAGGTLVRAANGFTWNDTTSLGGYRRMNNAQALSADGTLGLLLPFAGGSLGARGIVSSYDIGIPGSLTYVSSQAKQRDTSASVSLYWNTDRLSSDALTLDLKGFYRYEELTYSNPLFPPDSLHRTHSASADLTQKLTVSPLFAAVYGGSVSYDLAESTNLAQTKDRLNLAGFLSLPFSLLETLTVTPSARYDYYSDFPGYLSLQLGAVLLLSDTSSLKASAGSAYRTPTLNELYWYESDGFMAGNPNLQPETSYSGEVGYSLADGGLSLDAAIFARLAFNTIDWDFTLFPSIPVNIGKSFLPGVELHGKAALTDRISLQADYTFIYSLLLQYGSETIPLAADRRAPWTPLHALSARIGWDDGVSSFGVEERYVGKQYTDSANTESAALPAYFITNADYRLAVSGNLTFSVVLRNLFNAEYQTQNGYPMPPFSIQTGVNIKF